MKRKHGKPNMNNAAIIKCNKHCGATIRTQNHHQEIHYRQKTNLWRRRQQRMKSNAVIKMKCEARSKPKMNNNVLPFCAIEVSRTTKARTVCFRINRHFFYGRGSVHLDMDKLAVKRSISLVLQYAWLLFK